jgi:hypothetical protein
MSLPYGQQWQLRRIHTALRGSDPHLVSMLAIFTLLTSDEDMPGREKMPEPLPWGLRWLAWAASAAAWLAGRTLIACGSGLHLAARGYLAAHRFLGMAATRSAATRRPLPEWRL